MNRDKPKAFMVGLQSSSLLDMAGVRVALATALLPEWGIIFGTFGTIGGDTNGRVYQACIAIENTRYPAECG